MGSGEKHRLQQLHSYNERPRDVEMEFLSSFPLIMML